MSFSAHWVHLEMTQGIIQAVTVALALEAIIVDRSDLQLRVGYVDEGFYCRQYSERSAPNQTTDANLCPQGIAACITYSPSVGCEI